MGDGASVMPRWHIHYGPVALPETPEALGPWGLEVEGGLRKTVIEFPVTLGRYSLKLGCSVTSFFKA